MSVEKAKEFLDKTGLGGRLTIHAEESDTVEHAAALIGCLPAHIAKTMAFLVDGAPVAVVCAGDAKVKNGKYKAFFGKKAMMVPFAEVEQIIGHEPGGVCPFGVNEGVKVYLDKSLKRFETVYAAGGARNATVELTPAELETATCAEWIDICEIV